MATTSYTTLNGVIVSENRGGVKRDYMRDSLGSTVALLDSTQTKTDTFFYWPYGEIRTQTGTTKTPFTFVGTLGYYMDIASSLFYVRMRHLRTLVARWLTVDPLWPGQPAYAYANQSPQCRADPSGLQVGGGGHRRYGERGCYIIDVQEFVTYMGFSLVCFLFNITVQVWARCKDSFVNWYTIIAGSICIALGSLIGIGGAPWAGFVVTLICFILQQLLLQCLYQCESDTGDYICGCIFAYYCLGGVPFVMCNGCCLKQPCSIQWLIGTWGFGTLGGPGRL